MSGSRPPPSQLSAGGNLPPAAGSRVPAGRPRASGSAPAAGEAGRPPGDGGPQRSHREPPLTTQRSLAPGAVLRYRAVEATEGEPHIVRGEVGTAGPGRGTGRPLLCLVHLTDLQLADVQSPIRFEFLNRHVADPRYAHLVPMHRPQEALAARAVDATLRTVNALSGPATGAPLQLAVTTGDAIDNAQWNEVQMFLALFDGGWVVPDSGGRSYEGVQSLGWPDDIFWRPDCADGGDLFRREYGFPHHPGLLHRAPRGWPAGPVAGVLRQPRGPQPGRRGADHGPRRRGGRRPKATAVARRFRPRPGTGAVRRVS